MKKDIARMITKKTSGGPGGASGLCPTRRGCSRGHRVAPGAPRVPRGAPRGCLASEQRFCSQEMHCLAYSRCCQGHSRPGAGGLRPGAPAVSAGHLDPKGVIGGGPQDALRLEFLGIFWNYLRLPWGSWEVPFGPLQMWIFAHILFFSECYWSLGHPWAPPPPWAWPGELSGPRTGFVPPSSASGGHVGPTGPIGPMAAHWADWTRWAKWA